MTKLSELLEAAVCDMFDQANDTVPESVAETDRADARKLRAIAPALVEYVAASHYFLSTDDDPDYHDRVQRYKNAWVAVHGAMKEAGVTCE